MATSTQDIADSLVEAFKSVEPFEDELNERVEAFLQKAKNFQFMHRLPLAENKYAWATASGWQRVTVHNIGGTGVEVRNIDPDWDEQYVTFDDMDNADAFFENALASGAEVRERNAVLTKAEKRRQLEAELAALDA